MNALDVGLMALDIAAEKTRPSKWMPTPPETLCAACGYKKRLHGVWVHGEWFCPGCVTNLELKP